MTEINLFPKQPQSVTVLVFIKMCIRDRYSILLATANGQTAMSVWNFTIYKSSR